MEECEKADKKESGDTESDGLGGWVRFLVILIGVALLVTKVMSCSDRNNDGENLVEATEVDSMLNDTFETTRDWNIFEKIMSGEAMDE